VFYQLPASALRPQLMEDPKCLLPTPRLYEDCQATAVLDFLARAIRHIAFTAMGEKSE
jgi:hypothetical protein